ncbi:unnamed protein product [Danaus chrysippus]|uniref:(African queen) hypothetical protein n=1 Tax=Danaus chrysippus TaxID=151541 RepID=A0A8J2QQI3_9NEOP|nr:unnamed protein product [Danaus chrysippus]
MSWETSLAPSYIYYGRSPGPRTCSVTRTKRSDSPGGARAGRTRCCWWSRCWRRTCCSRWCTRGACCPGPRRAASDASDVRPPRPPASDWRSRWPRSLI